MTEDNAPRHKAAEGEAACGFAKPEPDDVVGDAFRIADSLFRQTAKDFHNLTLQMRGDGSGGQAGGQEGMSGDGLKQALRLARDLRVATQQMLEERNRIDKLRKEIAGDVGGGDVLDLEAARDEIRRRLACLRRAAGG